MLYIVNSRLSPGVSREQAIEHLTRKVDQEEWELVQKGFVSHWLYKVGDQPGMVLVVNAADIEDVKRRIGDLPLVKAGVLEVEIDPAEHFPNFN